MKSLNFFPYYKELLLQGKKYTSFRLAEKPGFVVGEQMVITLGWDEENSIELFQTCIRKSYSKRIKELDSYDFDGESLDCFSIETVKMTLGCIYKKVLNENDKIWIIKFNPNS